MIYKLLWKWFGKQLLKEYLSEQNKPLTLAKLSYAFTDCNGKKYYSFPKDMALPLDRYGQLIKYLSFLSARMTPAQMDKIIDAALELIQQGIGKDKNAAKVAALLYELRDRERLIVPAQLVYDILAVQYVREDELPSEFDNEIHMQKVSAFMADSSKGEFFFLLPELKNLTSLSAISINEWAQYLEEDRKQDEQLNRILKVIFSDNVSKREKPTSKV